MTTKHTLGPWQMTASDHDATMITNDAGAMIAGWPVGGGSPENCANARLIAAAPDLLAALEACSFREDIMDDELGDMIEAAIARAKG